MDFGGKCPSWFWSAMRSDCWWLLSFGPFKGFQHIPSYSQAQMYSFWLLIIYIGVSSNFRLGNDFSPEKNDGWAAWDLARFPGWLGATWGAKSHFKSGYVAMTMVTLWLWYPNIFLWLAPNPSFIDDFSMKKRAFLQWVFPLPRLMTGSRVYMIWLLPNLLIST